MSSWQNYAFLKNRTRDFLAGQDVVVIANHVSLLLSVVSKTDIVMGLMTDCKPVLSSLLWGWDLIAENLG